MLLGNERIGQQLQQIVSSGRVASTYLFCGLDGVGKSLFAKELAIGVMGERFREAVEKGSHPDLLLYRPEGKLGLHSMESIRGLCEEVYYPPFEAAKKVFIIEEADRMLPYSANALLKTLEEPSPRSLLILIGSSRAAFLPTIVSRAAVFQFLPIHLAELSSYLEKKLSIKAQEATLLAHRSGGSVGKALKLFGQGEGTRGKIFSLLKGEGDDRSRLALIKSCAAEVEERAQREKGEEEAATAKAQEGKIASAAMQEEEIIFDTILGWYRDLHLLLVGGARHLLKHPDQEQALEKRRCLGNVPPLEQVYDVIEKGRLSLSRSTSLSLVLENILLQLR